jgi:O-antigen/teichoic acid export membrane protein
MKVKNFFQKELIKWFSIAFFLKILGVIASYIFIYLVTHYFDAKGMGIFALLFTLLQILSLIGRFGIDTAIVKFVSESIVEDKCNILKIYRSSFLLVSSISIFISIVYFLIAPFIAEVIFHKPHLTLAFQLISIAIFPLSIRFLNAEFLKSLKEITQYALLQYIIVFILGILILFILIISYDTKNNVILPIVVLVISMVITSIISFILLYKKIKKLYSFRKLKELLNTREFFSFKKLLNIAIPLFFASSFSFFIVWTDTIMLGIFRTEEEIGIYNVAIKVVFIMLFPLTAISSVLMPKIATFWKTGSMEKIKDINKKSLLLIASINSVPLFIFLFFPEFVLSIFGKSFIDGSKALIMLSIGYFINAILGVLEYTLQMTIYQKFYSNLIIFVFFINLTLNYILIPLYGINGAALATSFSLILSKILIIYFYFRKF